MSLRNRARRLQRATGWTYQQALEKLRALGARPAELARATGWPLAECDLYLVKPRIKVIDARDPLERVCEDLLESAHARSVRIFDADLQLAAQAGEGSPGAWFTRFAGGGRWMPTRELALDVPGGQALIAPVRGHGVVIVVFDSETSLGLVRLRVRHALDELERLLRRRRGWPTVPPGGKGGPGGLPAEVRVTSDIPRGRSSERPKAKATKRRRNG